MSGASFSPVNAVTTNSEFNAVSKPDASADTAPAILGSERQQVAESGATLPGNATESATASREEVVQATESIAERVEDLGRKLEFSINEDLGKIVVTVFDKASEEVIRQIPGEQAIAIAEHIASLSEEAPVLGLLLDSEA